MEFYFALAAFLIGFCAGLRSATPWAVLGLAAWCGCLRFGDGWLGLLNRPIVAIGFVVAAIGEYFVDKLPYTPNRTDLPLLLGRIISGTGAALALAIATGNSILIAAAIGASGAVAGTFGGYKIRTKLSARYNKLAVALTEDAAAIAIGVLSVAILNIF